MTRTLGRWLAFTITMTFVLALNTHDLRAEDGAAAAYHPVITVSEGNVMVMGVKYSIWEPAPVGTLLLSGDKVKTGWGSRAEIRFASGTVRLFENSMLIVPSIGVQDRRKDIQDVVVERGDVFFDINPLGVKKQFHFETKNVQGGVKGTAFLVSYVNDGTTVNVYRGTVWAGQRGHEKDKVKVLKAGNAVRMEKGQDFGDVRTFKVDIDAADYEYNVPGGLDSRSRLPADYHANPDNNGVRARPDKTDKTPPGLEKK